MTLDLLHEAATAAAKEVHIVVAALTFRRPEGIAKLLDVLQTQVHDAARPFRLTVLVVDNVDHYVNEEAPEVLTKAIRDFTSSH